MAVRGQVAWVGMEATQGQGHMNRDIWKVEM